MQLKEKKSTIEKDKRKLESELERQRQTIGKQVFLQVVQKKQQQQNEIVTSPMMNVPTTTSTNTTTTQIINNGNNQNAIIANNTTNLLPDILNPKSPRETTRRQWDKTNKNNSLIEIDQHSFTG
jgi:GH24 family phage-related lysozyme (muramidase)